MLKKTGKRQTKLLNDCMKLLKQNGRMYPLQLFTTQNSFGYSLRKTLGTWESFLSISKLGAKRAVPNFVRRTSINSNS